MGIISDIKKQAAKSGSSKEKILYIKSDEKVRVRFLQELDDGYSFTFHDSFEKGVNTICREELGKRCPLCGNDGLRTRQLYAWSVYNYDTKRVEIALFAVNNCTPVSQLVDNSEARGTIMDRDYVLAKNGKQQSTTYTVIAQDKQKFRNEKAKPFTKSAMLKLIMAAFPYEEDTEDDEDEDYIEEEVTKKKSNKKSDKKSSKKYEEEEDDDLDEDFEDFEEDEEEEEEEEEKSKKKSDKSKKKVKESYAALDEPIPGLGLSKSEIEDMLEDEDIDIDDFCEYHELKSLKKLDGYNRKKVKKLIKEYLTALDDE